MWVFYFLISIFSTIIGTICGIGGGIIIKPVMDFFGLADAVSASFLSACTVLSMSIFAVVFGAKGKDNRINARTSTPLAVGAAVGGVSGRLLFDMLIGLFENSQSVTKIQSACLAIITTITLLFIVFKAKIKTHNITNIYACVLIGMVLGLISSFLGIGGGPINLMVLLYFFGLDTKSTVQNSLYIIASSQLASLTLTSLSPLPEVSVLTLSVMVLGAILGAIIGRLLHKKISAQKTNSLMTVLMLFIITICVFLLFL